MKQALTEQLHNKAKGLDVRPAAEIALILAEAQTSAAKTVEQASDAIAAASTRMAASIRNQGVLHYVAAGSSGLMAAADAQELGGTFSIPATQIRIHMAGGLPKDVEMPGDTEDSIIGLDDALKDISSNDSVIAISASGTTPFTVYAAEIAKNKGATIIGIANNADCPLLRLADHPIHLATPPELVSGSTRLGAGTAQKIALNTLSTLMAVHLGHVHDGMMVNLRADNTKLEERATRIVAQIAQTDHETARAALARSGGAVKPAILMHANDITRLEAEDLLARTDGHLRPALET